MSIETLRRALENRTVTEQASRDSRVIVERASSRARDVIRSLNTAAGQTEQAQSALFSRPARPEPSR
jgi:hypothetical protein